jgi:hypothetical protein
MINYHTYYLNENKKSIEKWDFDSSNPTHLIGDYNHNLIANELLKNLSTIASNKDVIDIGCRDGFYSFLFEKSNLRKPILRKSKVENIKGGRTQVLKSNRFF